MKDNKKFLSAAHKEILETIAYNPVIN